MERFFTLLLILVLSCGLAQAQQKHSISGKVTDNTGEALTGANVYINGTTIGTATNAKGEFTLKNITAGNYQICASFSGFKRYRENIELNASIQNLEMSMEESTGTLGEVVVTGTGTPHHLKTAPVPTELLNSQMIESAAAPDFINLMGSVSPSFDFSPNTMGSFMQLNGLGNDFIVILIDGRRVYGDMGGMNDLGRINPNNIERVEVVKGASSALYGSDAIAGVINIITKKSKRSISANHNTQYGTYNTYQSTTNIDFNSKIVSGHTTFSQSKTDGWQNSPYEVDGDELVETDEMTQNAYLRRNVRQDLEFRISDKLSIYGGGSYYMNDNKRALSVKDYGLFFEDFSYNAGAKYLLSKSSNITFDYTSDTYKYYYKYNQTKEGKYEAGDYQLNSDQRRDDYNLRWISKLGKHQTITLGSELVQEFYRSEGRLQHDEESVNTLSFYLQDEISLFDDLMLTAGLRVVKHDNFGTIATPKLSALYQLGHFNLRGTYSRGFKAPTLKEQYYYYEKRGTLYLGNTDLDPQKSNYYSAGVDYNNKWLSTNMSVYQNDVDGLIAYENTELLPGDADNGIKKRRQHFNIEEARTRGFDVMVDVKLPLGFSFGGGYSYVDAMNLTEDIRLDYVARHYGNVRVGYFHHWNNYHLNVQLLGRLQDDKYYHEEPNAKGYDLWKLTTTHQLLHSNKVNLKLTAGIDNVFDYVDDVPYGENRGTINPGRTYFVGVNINFAN
ncbi:TonB-dependent receptor [Carboxylicivirga sp. A043]|uniref:TonB-dependent receptor n=1 Tax=Carboxylicivirga litoralis TaxID=2816963 RepID=UPI0021CB1BB0|nr:TonB-dependent receptor [Carboxylicivirga sp. A043]MCU4155116.1 TonB-dependent receptor [Carboxylicivirga sp. A043]